MMDSCQNCTYLNSNLFFRLDMPTYLILLAALLLAVSLALILLYLKLIAFSNGLSSVAGRSKVIISLHFQLACERIGDT